MANINDTPLYMVIRCADGAFHIDDTVYDKKNDASRVMLDNLLKELSGCESITDTDIQDVKKQIDKLLKGEIKSTCDIVGNDLQIEFDMQRAEAFHPRSTQRWNWTVSKIPTKKKF